MLQRLPYFELKLGHHGQDVIKDVGLNLLKESCLYFQTECLSKAVTELCGLVGRRLHMTAFTKIASNPCVDNQQATLRLDTHD